MKALTLTEPWASLVALGAKRIETRDWSTSYRGPIAIHAAKGMKLEDLEFARNSPYAFTTLNAKGMAWDSDRVKGAFLQTRGCIVATARLRYCISLDHVKAGDFVQMRDGFRIKVTDLEFALGGYGPGRVGFVLGDVVRLDTPIPAVGKLGLWEWEEPDGCAIGS